ncbi:uncharacterized protein LOC125231432 [Leguminivora glycinivorella]|uniref:uncharacterized protein LOC125231432 n=1 Tax=Leguminivora glycinivorella TaxID=1035111 RepID=UPI00200FEDE9|nr:uncharacterized protein LOC125231432 [Leguminivora glycinivorella]
MLNFLISVLLASLSVQYASAIQCYECSSVNNSMCLDPTIYDKDTLQKFMTLTDCGTHGNQEFFCRKIIQTILRKGHESEVRVHRGCGWVRSRRACYKADNDDHLETVCQCFDDGCNGGNSVVVAKWILLVASATVVLNKWR